VFTEKTDVNGTRMTLMDMIKYDKNGDSDEHGKNG